MTAPAQAATSTPATQATEEAPGRTGANALDPSASPTPDSGSSGQEQVSRGPDYFREAFSRIRGYTQAAKSPDSAPQAPPASGQNGRDSERAAKPQNGAASTASPAAAPALPQSTTQQERSPGQSGSPGVLQLTQAELDRRVQAETDRRLAKQRADEDAQRARDEERELRRNDPLEYARRMEDKDRQLEAERQKVREATDLLTQQLTVYDRGILDPFVGALPDSTRQKILESVDEEGIPGRQKIASATLQALRTQWLAEGRDSARAALMRDPAFIKEVLARHGGQRQEPDAAPALPPSAAARPQTTNDSVNSWMRRASQETRYVSGRA